MNLTITPENAALNERLQELHIAFTKAYVEHKHMVEDEAPILTSWYLDKLGGLQLRLLENQTELSRIKMKISLIQAAINRNEKPDWNAINREIETRLEKYYKQIEEQSRAVDSAQKVLSSLLSEEDAKKLKEVFYVLCRRLHPDVNPGQTEEEKDLFVKVKAAYDLQNLQELQRILLLLEEGGNADIATHSSDEKRRRIEQLEKNIAELKGKMMQLEQSFPFNMRALLSDEEQLAGRQDEIQEEIDRVAEEIAKQQAILDLLEDE
ncbi:MAG: hypothetical protein ACKO7B_02060 [Flavobacteriales bacterium]